MVHFLTKLIKRCSPDMSKPTVGTTKLALVGYGKMGRLLEKMAPSLGFEVALKLDEFNNVDGAGITSENFEDISAAIDFSIPQIVPANAEKIAGLGVNLVIGTTGWLEELSRVKLAVEENQTGLVYGANFSVGVLAFYGIVEAAAKILATQSNYDAWAYEVHHKMKQDSPSGTMLRILDVIKQVDYDRDIDLATNRVGSMPGTHEVGFDSEADTIRLSHTARSRTGFALGALKAARWVVNKRGLYEFSSIWEQVG